MVSDTEATWGGARLQGADAHVNKVSAMHHPRRLRSTALGVKELYSKHTDRENPRHKTRHHGTATAAQTNPNQATRPETKRTTANQKPHPPGRRKTAQTKPKRHQTPETNGTTRHSKQKGKPKTGKPKRTNPRQTCQFRLLPALRAGRGSIYTCIYIYIYI